MPRNRPARASGGPATAPKVPARRKGMNGTETKYADHLAARQAIGLVREFYFEAVTLKLADDLRYTPDFLVILADGTVELHEVKGFWRDDAKAKAKVCADKYPFPVFVAAWSRDFKAFVVTPVATTFVQEPTP